MKNTLGERIQERLDELVGKVSVMDIARVCKTSPQSVYQWIAGTTKEPKPSNLAPAAKLLGVHFQWLIDGTKPKLLGNLDPGPDIKGKVPLISWVQAGNFAAVIDNLQPGDAEDWIPTVVPIHEHTYALRVRGDSMTNPQGEPTFPHGQIIIVEPDAIDSLEKLASSPVSSLVIVKRVDDDEATFKQLVKLDGKFWLKPLNPQYPMLEMKEGDVLCGIVREKPIRYF